MGLRKTNTSLPVDGFGGWLYWTRFNVPTYFTSSDIYSTLTWASIDEYYQDAVYTAIVNAVALTICVVVLLYVVALTHPQKRRLWIHTLILSALILQIACHGIDTSLSVHSPRTSAYIQLTQDVTMLQLSSNYKALGAGYHATACLSFACLQGCLYLQARPLLTFVKIKHKWVYQSMLGVLTLNAITAFALRLTMAVLIMINIEHPLAPAFPNSDAPIFRVHIVFFALSIGAWSLIFFISTVAITFSRRGKLISKNTVYQSTLNVIAIIGLESFLVPIVLAVFVIVRYVNPVLSHASQLLLSPSVLIALPLCSLFASSRTNHNELPRLREVDGDGSQPIPLPVPVQEHRDDNNHISTSITYRQSGPFVTEANVNDYPDPAAPSTHSVSKTNNESGKNVYHPLDLELKMIDEIEVDGVENSGDDTTE